MKLVRHAVVTCSQLQGNLQRLSYKLMIECNRPKSQLRNELLHLFEDIFVLLLKGTHYSEPVM